MRNTITKKICFTAAFTALVFACTFIQIRMPYGGNVNAGDCMILLCAALTGWAPAALAGGIGAALCDLAMGFGMYAPFTLLIKAVEGAVCGLLIHFIKKAKLPYAARIFCTVAAFAFSAIVMALGYFGVNCVMLGVEIALAEGLVFDAVQGIVSVVIASILLFVARLDVLFDKLFNNKTKQP